MSRFGRVMVEPPPAIALQRLKEGHLPSMMEVGLWSQETASILLYELSRLPLSQMVDALEELANKGVVTEQIRAIVPLAKRYATIQSFVLAKHEQEPLWSVTEPKA